MHPAICRRHPHFSRDFSNFLCDRDVFFFPKLAILIADMRIARAALPLFSLISSTKFNVVRSLLFVSRVVGWYWLGDRKEETAFKT